MREVRTLAVHAAVLCGYAALAVAYSWPLVLHLGTHITGSPEGDAGAYVWNLWAFQREAAAGHPWAFRTASILSLTEPADLSLHNYTVFADVVGLALQKQLGLVASFNVIYLALQASSAYAMFLLARPLAGATAEAFLAGALFGFSPFLIARGTAHFSLVAAAPLPLFALSAARARRSLDWTWAAAAGMTMAWAAYCDPYYLVFCALILAAGLAHATLALSWERRPARPVALARVLEALPAVLFGVAFAIAVSGGGRFRLAGMMVSAKTLYTPVLLLILALAGRLWLSLRPRVAFRREVPLAAWARLLVVGVGAALIPLAPLLLSLAGRLRDGTFVSPAILWRSSPRGVDVLSLLMPNPSHATFGEPFRFWLDRQRSDGFVENAASLTLTAMAVVTLALWRRLPLPRAWIAFTVFFAALALGPFVTVAGFNTAVPTPWTLLRYLPGVGLIHSPTRFAIVAMLGFAMIFAAALRSLSARPRAHRAVILALVAILLGLELSPAPRRLHAAEIPALFDLIGRDPCPVRVLELPFGVRDGTRSIGNFSAGTQFRQTRHCKPILGGYLSRISEKRVRAYRRLEVANVLLKLSGGEPVAFEEAQRARRAAARFLRRGRVGFVVIDHSRTSRKLRRFAYNAFELQSIAQNWPYELFLPRASLCDGVSTQTCVHSAPDCTVKACGLGRCRDMDSPPLEGDRR
jgi:hypothetical protein